MLKLFARMGAVGILLATGLAFAPPSSAAPPPVQCPNPNTYTGQCDITVTDPGQGGGSTTSPGNGGGGPSVCKDRGFVVPCSNEYGSWVDPPGCYATLMTPQPPAGDPAWQGHTGGAFYNCTYAGGTAMTVIWLAGPPAVVIDPAVLAQQAIDSMNLHAIAVGITPEPGKLGAVGLPTYLWVAQPAPNTYGPITRSASAGAVTVTATARVEQIRWSMGDGHTVTCNNAGTPYQNSYGARPSPTCGYTYKQARDPYTVAATSHWVVDWAGGGQTGTIPLDLTANTQIRVGEVQVLVQ